MQTLRIVNVQIIDSSNIDVTFTENLTPNLITSNISILSDTSGVPDSSAILIKISGPTLSITCQPLTPLANYTLQFQTVPLYIFESVNGDARISEDGISNTFIITAPLESDNPIKNYFDSYFQGNIYNNQDDNTIVAKYLKALSVAFARALYDIRQVKNENYLSFDVIDETKIRGGGPFDRLNEEGAYEVLRVGRTPAGTSANITFSFPDFPSYPVTLQKQSNTEILTTNSLDKAGLFNINNLTLNLSNSPVTRITSIIFTLNTINPIYIYDIEALGYQILDSRYDQDFGFTYLQLENNQIRLSDKILADPLFSLDQIIRVQVSYESKNLGIVVDPSTITVYTTSDSTRETIPPITNVFNLGHAPITDASNNIPTLNGVTFIDPNTSANTPHPAFITELPFRLNALPTTPGQYSIDYLSGTVYVFGNDLNNDGTGPFPPLATYKYRFTYQSELDYVYDSDLLDLVSLPNGNLVNSNSNVNFQYEEVFIPNVDYKVNLHQEVLSERIGNKLVALNAFRTKNAPITNVFKIFNETSGEIYTLNRWSNDKVFFRYNTPPKLVAQIAERASFNQIVNELLFVNTTITNLSSLRIFKIFLNNNTIISSTEDSIASSFNTSLVFNNGNVFVQEKWFDREFSETINVNRLTSTGQYMIDYVNGIVYCVVSLTQNFDIGTVSYKNNNIIPQFPHIISVDDIYYRISPLNPKNKQFSYISFDDGSIIPAALNFSDELFLNDNATGPYQINSSNIGIFTGAGFIAGVTNQIGFMRSVYAYDDLQNSTHPFNFANSSSSNGFNVSVSSYTQQFFSTVQFDGSNFFVLINQNVPYLSTDITYTFSVTRVSDSASLWNITGTVVPGNMIKLILPGINSPVVGNQVSITYTFAINNLARVVIDYNKGDYFIDYTYLNDEIIVSYEYGDNVLDFRESLTVPTNTEYYVSYRVGALRDALLKNFGTLVNVPELSVFDVDFNRERYRDALTAALTSFIQGPTVTAIKNIGKTISHIEPEIVESAFLNWSLGSSLLFPESITTTGSFELLPAKFNNGVSITSSDQTIKFPVNSNLRLEEGTFETWIAPNWNGLDNDAQLTFTILKDGYVIPGNQVFIGASGFHPAIENGIFSLDKNSGVGGTPNMNKEGVFIYYDKDLSGNFNRWFVKVIDGYVLPGSSSYKCTIQSNGKFYDNKSISIPKPSGLSITTGVNNISFSIAADGYASEGITFLSDIEHYILDFGETVSKNRLSIFKDTTGYINFRVFDKDQLNYYVSSDVSGWKAGDLHHVSASWKLNTRNNRDEMHLFLDGIEVPNIIRYGQKLHPYLHEKFRTVDPEEIVGSTNRDIVGSIDLVTTSGSATVTSSINFSSFNIFPGDTLFIDEPGFSPSGYTILLANGQTLTLTTTMPATITNGTFSVNRVKFNVTSDIDVAPNTTVSTIHALITGTDGYGSSGSNIISSLITNFSTKGILPGYLIRVDGYNLQFEPAYTILQVNGKSLVLNDNLPATFSSATFQVYSGIDVEIPGVRAIQPAYSISKDVNFNNILTLSNDVFAGDLVLVRTLGLNHKRVRKQYYLWSDGYENLLMTQLPPPISLDEAKITKVILSPTSVGPLNSILVGGVFDGYHLPSDGYEKTYQPSNTINGRTITATISGTNVDFSTATTVTIDGYAFGIGHTTETITFNNYGSIDFTHFYQNIDFIYVNTKPINVLKNALTIVVKEKYPITHQENSGIYPVVKYSYVIGSGTTLTNDGTNAVRDTNFLFSAADTNNYLVISSPPSVAGYYLITGMSVDRKSVFIQSTTNSPSLPLTAFTNGVYQVLNVNTYRSGLQNGFFTFEKNGLPALPYLLNHGPYELDYFTYTQIKINPLNNQAYLGSDFNGNLQLNGIMDQVKIYSTMLTDTRIGETIPANQRSVTKDFNSLKPLADDANTLMIVNFDQYPFTNTAKIYANSNRDKNHFQSSVVINENFGNSLVVLDKPIILENNGILNPTKQGTIEFWVNPLFDTTNDPVNRFYFDAFGAVVEESVSVNSTSVKISAPASKILSVKLKAGDPRVDYFAGGKLEIDTQHAVQEIAVSTGNGSVTVSQPILQVITVKIVGDLTGADYFDNGTIGTDQKTIFLGQTLPSSSLSLIVTYQTTENKNITSNTQVIRLNRKLPYQNSQVVVNYIPKGLQGDRMSIFKDSAGYMNFAISASEKDYIVRAPTRWSRNTWHRVKASYKVNGGVGTDELRLFLDGYEFTDVTFGTNIFFGLLPLVMGEAMPGGFIPNDGYALIQNIQFKDPINELYIGTEYTEENPIFSLIDNFRISDISRPIYAPFGEPLDVNYSTNLNAVFPVTQDLFTTFLMDFDEAIILNDDFTVLKNRESGLFDFSVNILDSFGIVNDNIKSKEALEALIKILKPANSRVFIQYTR
jgi:hypothetical protein